MRLIAEPFVGALPVRFGMVQSDVAAAIGAAESVRRGAFRITVERRPHLAIGYTAGDGTVFEVNCHPGMDLDFEGTNLLALEDPIAFLRNFDPQPFLWVGMVIFLKLGIRVSGFHDGDDKQKSIAMVKTGYWDEFKDDFVPFAP